MSDAGISSGSPGEMGAGPENGAQELSCLLVRESGRFASRTVDDLEAILRGIGVSRLRQVSTGELTLALAAVREEGGIPVVFLEAGAMSAALLDEMHRHRAVGVLLDSEENAEIPSDFVEGRVPELLLHPFRAGEVFRVLLHARRQEAWGRLEDIHSATEQAISRLEKDVALAESIQQVFWPKRFPEVKGFRIEHRYLAGIRGGDWLDVAESSDGSALSIVLSDGSSTGLSSLVSAAVARMASRVSLESSRTPAETVPLLLRELQPVLQAKHRLSLFYGVITRADLKFRWVCLGAVRAWLGAGVGRPFEQLDVHGPGIQGDGPVPGSVLWSERELKGDDRLVLASDGFIEALGGESEAVAAMDRRTASPSLDLLNDWVYAVKKDFEGEDDLPRQDCTGLVLEVLPRVLKLAPKG
jgi:hypothetical protein